MDRLGVARRVAPDPAYQLRHHPLVYLGELWGAYRALPELSIALGCPASDLARFWDDLIERDRFYERIRAREAELANAHRFSPSPGGRADAYSEVLYLVARAIKPKLVVETGVALGYSSAYLLQALHDNAEGSLHSIDLPTTTPGGRVNADGFCDRVHVPSEDATGAVIPNDLRDRWHLRLAPSNPALGDLLELLKPIDLFFHDSEHSYPNMMWEYRTAWPAIRPGGVLLSDDIHRNSAFAEFSRSVDGRTFVWFGRSGHRGGIRRPAGS